jgi:hypothetical protein
MPRLRPGAGMALWADCTSPGDTQYHRGIITAGLSGGTVPVHGMNVSSLEALPAQRLAQLQASYDGAPVGCVFWTKLFATSASTRNLLR